MTAEVTEAINLDSPIKNKNGYSYNWELAEGTAYLLDAGKTQVVPVDAKLAKGAHHTAYLRYVNGRTVAEFQDVNGRTLAQPIKMTPVEQGIHDGTIDITKKGRKQKPKIPTVVKPAVAPTPAPAKRVVVPAKISRKRGKSLDLL